MSYFNNVLIAIDQLGNALAAGNPDVTISARTGYFANIEKTRMRWWWNIMEFIIDFAFKPFDGPNHCLDSYYSDQESGHSEGSDLARGLIGLFIVFLCPLIAVLTRLWVFFHPEAAYQYQAPDHDT